MADEVRLIDANALHKEITSFDHSVIYKDWVQSAIASAPTISDVAPVVRCKECKYSYKSWLSDILGGIWCTFWQKTQGKAWNMMHFDDFCSHGAKKIWGNNHESNCL